MNRCWRPGRRYCALVVCLALVTMPGCGGSSEQPRYELSGEVTRNGEPVPSGMITFRSLVSTGGTADGFAPIKEGKFDTSDGGRGHFGGPHEITITASVPVDPGNPDLGTKSLFEPDVVTMNLPYGKATRHFNVSK